MCVYGYAFIFLNEVNRFSYAEYNRNETKDFYLISWNDGMMGYLNCQLQLYGMYSCPRNKSLDIAYKGNSGLG